MRRDGEFADNPGMIPHITSAENLRSFTEFVRNAPTDSNAERIVRLMVEKAGKNCPMPLLVHLGQCIADYRKSEMLDEAQQN